MTNSKPPPKPGGLMSPANAAAVLRPLRKLSYEEALAQAKRDQHRPPPDYIVKKPQS